MVILAPAHGAGLVCAQDTRFLENNLFVQYKFEINILFLLTELMEGKHGFMVVKTVVTHQKMHNGVLFQHSQI